MHRKQDSPREPRGFRYGRTALLAASVLGAGMLATAAPASATQADGCDGGCGYGTSGAFYGNGYGAGFGGAHGTFNQRNVYNQGAFGAPGVLGARAGLPRTREDEDNGIEEIGPSCQDEMCDSVTHLHIYPNPGYEGEPIGLHVHVDCTDPVSGEAVAAADGGTVTFLDENGDVIAGPVDIEFGLGPGVASANAEVTLEAGTHTIEAASEPTLGGEACTPSSTSQTFEVLHTHPPFPGPWNIINNTNNNHQSQRQSQSQKLTVVVIGGHAYKVKGKVKAVISGAPAAPSAPPAPSKVPVTG